MTTQIGSEPVVAAGDWKSGDMSDSQRWIHHFSETELVEIDAALAAVVDKEVAEIEPGDFPLREFGAELEKIGKDLQFGRGFVLIRGLPMDRYTDDEVAKIFWGIGTHLGHAVPQNKAGDLLGHIHDQGVGTGDPTVRGYQTRELLPFHSDVSDIVGLVCLRNAKSGGLSSVVSSLAVHNIMLEERPDLLKLLYGQYYVDHRGEEPEGAAPYYPVRPFSWTGGHLNAYLSHRYIMSAHERFPELTALTPEQIEAFEMVQDIAYRDGVALHMEFQPGDMQFLNNYTTLHSRTSYEDHSEPDMRRYLLRLWLTAVNGRPVPPELAGRRVGVRV